MKRKLFSLALLALFFSNGVKAQSILYPQTFDYAEVTLGDGVFKTAQELNYKTLMAYDVDRLMTPFFNQAGLTDWAKRHPNFTNWCEGTFRLDGHVGGHYLTALALAYASCREPNMKMQLKDRLDYMVNCMDSCQRQFDHNQEGLYGYIGGLPYNNVWTDLYKGNTATFTKYGGDVPFYVMHKILAGMRDAYVYGGNEKAKRCFLKLCDWAVNVVSHLSDEQLQGILNWEHGGMNETLADAYALTGDRRYLEGARRYSHQMMIDGMQTADETFLDGKHANTQVPKYIGFERMAQTDKANTDADLIARWHRAAKNFWLDVALHRTVALGGNSIDEHFLPANRSKEYINNPNGPESCNTNNMLKLTEDLFADNHDARLADFYEYAMLNHLLSTQNPTTGGYVYFTSLRPDHYRVYSQVNQAMWCCVGTGMENHSKYGEFIYTHAGNDTLFVNLYVASKLNNKMFAVEQQTHFPYSQQSVITISRKGRYVMALRHPGWCRQGFSVKVNGKEVDGGEAGSYLYLSRSWKAGDRVEVSFPMQLEMTECPHLSDYVAFRYGPVLLGAKTNQRNLDGLFADESRMGHSASGPRTPLNRVPILIGDRHSVLDSVYCINPDSLKFMIRGGLYNQPQYAGLVLQPFFTIHESRYMLYWQQVTPQRWDEICAQVAKEEKAKEELESRTLDFVATGEQQSDAGHARQGEFNTGYWNGEYFISCEAGQRFSYQLSTKGVSEGVTLFCRYTHNDNNRIHNIYVDGKLLAHLLPINEAPSTDFYDVEYAIPQELLKGKSQITVTFAAEDGIPLRSVFYLRLLKHK
ncbi:MAG: beta-L-arabinofuranosidase domain-containing protein [Prevotella sp.]|jgi:DUF1680 family protein